MQSGMRERSYYFFWRIRMQLPSRLWVYECFSFTPVQQTRRNNVLSPSHHFLLVGRLREACTVSQTQALTHIIESHGYARLWSANGHAFSQFFSRWLIDPITISVSSSLLVFPTLRHHFHVWPLCQYTWYFAGASHAKLRDYALLALFA